MAIRSPSASIPGPAVGKYQFHQWIFAWAPTRAYASTTNPITIRVTDNGYPSLSATQTVLVTVLDYLDLSLAQPTSRAARPLVSLFISGPAKV